MSGADPHILDQKALKSGPLHGSETFATEEHSTRRLAVAQRPLLSICATKKKFALRGRSVIDHVEFSPIVQNNSVSFLRMADVAGPQKPVPKRLDARPLLFEMGA